MATPSVSVLDHSLAMIVKQSLSLPTLLEVRVLLETNNYFCKNAGIAGAIIFLILLVLLVWMICVRATRPKKQEKVGLGPGAEMGHQGGANFYYGAPAPYAESIAPSHHSTYAHYYDDEEDGWDMPNFYNEGYMKDGLAGKMNSLARSNASLYGNKEELYDRLRRHAYQGGKKGS